MLMKRLSIACVLGMAMMTSTVSRADDSPMERQLRAAAAKGDAGKIEELLHTGVSVDTRDAARQTPLLIATHGDHVEAAKVLIDAGADVNAKDAIKDSPYLYAGARGHLDILRMTLAHGADVKSTNRYGGTALIPAAERGHVDTVRTLIAAGVDVNHINNLKWTALLEAIILGNGGPQYVQIVQLLVDAKADVNLADGKGVTPFQHARTRGYTEIERILMAAGAH